VQQAIIYTSVFISTQIGIFSSVLCAIVQVSDYVIERKQRLGGSCFELVLVHGPSFALVLEEAGNALLFSTKAPENPVEKPLSCGKWIQFSEGTVVRWKCKNGDTKIGSSDIGLISTSDGFMVYEGFDVRITADAEIVAHLDRRATPENVGA
jgi:hypothetical protein